MAETANRKFLSLNREALLMAATAAQSADVRVLEQLGVEPDAVSLLKEMRASDLDKLESFPASLLEVRFNRHNMAQLLQRINDEGANTDLTDRAIRGGIRQPNLNKLNGISRREFDRRCQMLGLPSKTPGRVNALSERKEIEVDGFWKKLTETYSDHSDTILERLVEAHELTGASIDQIWNLVIEQI